MGSKAIVVTTPEGSVSNVPSVIIAPITVEVQDGGVVDPSYAEDVSIAVVGGETFTGGTFTKPAVLGVATFNDLIASTPGEIEVVFTSDLATDSDPFVILEFIAASDSVQVNSGANSFMGFW